MNVLEVTPKSHQTESKQRKPGRDRHRDQRIPGSNESHTFKEWVRQQWYFLLGHETRWHRTRQEAGGQEAGRLEGGGHIWFSLWILAQSNWCSSCAVTWRFITLPVRRELSSPMALTLNYQLLDLHSISIISWLWQNLDFVKVRNVPSWKITSPNIPYKLGWSIRWKENHFKTNLLSNLWVSYVSCF